MVGEERKRLRCAGCGRVSEVVVRSGSTWRCPSCGRICEIAAHRGPYRRRAVVAQAKPPWWFEK